MNRADRMLEVLRDGRIHSREEIEERAPGPFFLTNNAASDLRKRGFDVRHRIKDGLHTYQLRGSLDEAAPSLGYGGVALDTRAVSSSEPSNRREADADAQEPLTTPAWDGGPLAVHADQLRLIEAA